MTNPFDDEEGEFLILINDEGQHSLWPAQFDVPGGWQAVGPRGKRQTCMAWIDENWGDMRPLSLVREMDASAKERAG